MLAEKEIMRAQQAASQTTGLQEWCCFKLLPRQNLSSRDNVISCCLGSDHLVRWEGKVTKDPMETPQRQHEGGAE